MHRCFSFRAHGPSRRLLPAAALLSLLLGTTAQAELFVTLSSGTTVRSYNALTGTPRNLNFISGLTGAFGCTVAGESLYVSRTTLIDRFHSRTGTPTATPLISGLASAYHSFVSGTDLYVASNSGNTVGKYTTGGATVNAALISGLDGPFYLAVSGNDLYVGNYDGGTIGRYTTAGSIVNSSFITGLSFPTGLAISNGKLYVANSGTNQIQTYDAQTGTPINASFVSGLTLPFPIAIYKGRLYVGNYTGGYIGVYDATTGATIDATFIDGTPEIYGLAIKPVPTPTVRMTAPRRVPARKVVHTLRGRSTEAEKVLVKAGRGQFRPAKGVRPNSQTTPWTFRARLKKGPNRIQVRAVNMEAVNSRLARATIVRARQ